MFSQELHCEQSKDKGSIASGYHIRLTAQPIKKRRQCETFIKCANANMICQLIKLSESVRVTQITSRIASHTVEACCKTSCPFG